MSTKRLCNGTPENLFRDPVAALDLVISEVALVLDALRGDLTDLNGRGHGPDRSRAAMPDLEALAAVSCGGGSDE